MPQPPLRVLMVARLLDAGGIERDVSKFARHLSSFGIHPHVGCFNSGGMRWRELENAGIPLVTIPVRSFRSLSAIKGAYVLRQYLVEKNIQIVHAFDLPADLFCVPLTRLFGVTVLASQLCYRDLFPRHVRWVMPVVDRLAKDVFVNCEGLADHLNIDWKLSRKHIHVCHNGYEVQEFNPLGRRRPKDLANASIVVGTVALLRPEKNIGMLIEAFAALHRVDDRARLLIVGSGPQKTELEQKVEELGLTDVCVFQPTVSAPADWMRAIDIFVLPSISEGFSNSLLEAMACGCCPVASRVGGTPELVNNGERGILFEPGNRKELSDALVQLAQHPKEQQRMAANAASFVREHLTIQQASARLAAIYRNLVSDLRNQND